MAERVPQTEVDFSVEFLESRRLLAGNVTAQINGAGNLIVNGDGADNCVDIEINSAGEVTIQGENGTVVDVGNLASSRVTGDVRINMRGGDDIVYLSGGRAEVPVRNVRMQLGAGDDTGVAYGLEEMTGGVTLIGGSGNNTMGVKYCEMSGDIRVTSGAGMDTIEIGDNERVRNVTASSGAGTDYTYLYNTKATGRVTISSTSGDDTIEVTDSYSGYEADRPQRFSIRSGSGNDTVRFEGSYAKYYSSSAYDIAQAQLVIIAGAGSDEVVVDSSFGDVRIIAGGGEDMITLGSHDGEAFVSGGGGLDTLTLQGDRFDLDLEPLVGIENVIEI